MFGEVCCRQKEAPHARMKRAALVSSSPRKLSLLETLYVYQRYKGPPFYHEFNVQSISIQMF